MRRPRTLMILAAMFAPVLAACSSGPGPVEELRSLFEVLGNPNFSPSRFGTQVYAVLDDASRAAVDARAKALGERLGAKVDGDEILQIRGFVGGARVSKVVAITREDERATLEVSFDPITFVHKDGADKPIAPGPTPAAAAPAPAGSASAPGVPGPRRIEVVKQSGRWRVAFVDLARLVAAVPLDATKGEP